MEQSPGYCRPVDDEQTEERHRQASLVIEHPNRYKVCEGCESIVRKRTIFCPLCNAYRFNPDPYTIIEQAIKLAESIPTTTL